MLFYNTTTIENIMYLSNRRFGGFRMFLLLLLLLVAPYIQIGFFLSAQKYVCRIEFADTLSIKKNLINAIIRNNNSENWQRMNSQTIEKKKWENKSNAAKVWKRGKTMNMMKTKNKKKMPTHTVQVTRNFVHPAYWRQPI